MADKATEIGSELCQENDLGGEIGIDPREAACSRDITANTQPPTALDSKAKFRCTEDSSGREETTSSPEKSIGTYCHYYVKSRKRFCKFTVCEGEEYCPIHLSETRSGFHKKRIPCPIDGRHSIYAHQVKQHLKKCSRVRDVIQECLQPFYTEGVNCPGVQESEKMTRVSIAEGEGYSSDPSSAGNENIPDFSAFIPEFYRTEDINVRQKATAADRFTAHVFTSLEVVEEWESQVNAAHEKMLEYLESTSNMDLYRAIANRDESIDTHFGSAKLTDYLKDLDKMSELEIMSPNKRKLLHLIDAIPLAKRKQCLPISLESLKELLGKHEIQEATIWCYVVEYLERMNMTDPVFLELGAGKGGVTQWFAHSHSSEKSLFLLVDRESRQNRKEAKTGAYVDRVLESQCVRLRIDLCDFDCGRFCDFLVSQKESDRKNLLENEYNTGPPWMLRLLAAGGVLDPCLTPEQIHQALMSLRSVHQDNTEELRAKLMHMPPRGQDKIPLVMTAKHLCGGASDIALRTLVQLKGCHSQISLLAAFAPCCFHSCTEKGLCGVEFLQEWFSDTFDYDRIRASVGWSTGAVNRKRRIGCKVKTMMIIARAVSSSISLENILYMIT